MSLEVFGRVSISCEAKREWHQPRANGKRRRRWLAMFVKVHAMVSMIEPNPYGNEIVEATGPEPAPDPNGLGVRWASLLQGSSREYRESNVQALVDGPMERQNLRSEFGCDGVIDDELLATSYVPMIDIFIERSISETGRYSPASRLLHWGHDSDLPDYGYYGARAVSRDRFGDWTYRMECPCGYRIRDISSTELHPVLDQLSAGGMHSISIQRLLPILDRA